MPDSSQRPFAPHLLVLWRPKVLTPKPAPPPRKAARIADRSADRAGHSAGLVADLTAARDIVAGERQQLDPENRSQGFAIHVEAGAGLDLKLDSLNKSGLSLLSVKPAQPGLPQEAVVWVPDDSIPKLVKKIRDFTSDTPRGKPHNAQLVANMEHIERAVLSHFWMEEEPFPGLDEQCWWELWLDPRTAEGNPIRTLHHLAEAHGWAMVPRSVDLSDFHVAQVEATARELSAVLATNACPAAIRRPSFAEALLTGERELQPGFVTDLADRLLAADDDAPRIVLLDTGIHQEHPLLRNSLKGAHSVTHEGPDDWRGHGTWMAGVSLYGDLDAALQSREPVALAHALESVKILSRATPRPPRVWGEVTATAVATAESSGEQPQARVYAMAVTAESTPERNGTDGRATLWSTAVDALAVGTDIDAREDQVVLLGAPDPAASRLVIVSAGNVREHQIGLLRQDDGSLSHLSLCDTSRIEDPAQAWNALTVGAYTELTDAPAHESFEGYRTLAKAGELSPFSRTSVTMLEASAIKPDIVLEGGNLLVDAEGTSTSEHDVVSVLTTGRPMLDRVLTTINATSAATAHAARLAALAFATYPQLRPETVRALLVHEAHWTDEMLKDVYTPAMRPNMSRGQVARLVLRRYGWGVPTEERVLSSASNAVTMMMQDSLTPFVRSEKSTIRLGELNLHQLPWPREQLMELGSTLVELRVTLSYFVEPNPGRVGVLGQHTYASHRLRFALKGPLEPQDRFEQRIALAAEAESDGGTRIAPFEGDSNWLVGTTNRNRGSLHSDIWHGTAAELADCGALAVYPAGGWWKYNNRADRVGMPVSYALLVSLATPEITADLYTPTAVRLDVPLPIEIGVQTDAVTMQLPLSW